MRGFLCIIICSLALGACNYTHLKHALDDGSDGGFDKTGASLDPATPISWNLVQSFSMTKCLDCHSGRKSPELSTMSMVQQNVDKVWSDVSQNKMPPAKAGYAPLSKCQLAILKAWMDLYMPETSTAKVGDLPDCAQQQTEPAPPPIKDLPLSYGNLIKAIIQPKCMKCHNPDGSGDPDDEDAKHTLFFPFAEITKRPKLWRAPGAQSKIVHMVTRTDEDRMPPSDEGPGLSADEVDYIVRWIDAGMPN